MGATAADTKREIEEIRKDVSSAVSELRRRVIRAVSPRTYLEFAKENPAAIVGALILLNVVVMMLVLGLNEIGSWFIPYVGKFLGWFVILILIGVIFFLAYKLVTRGKREFKISPLEGTREVVSEDVTWVRQLLTRNER